MTSPPRSDVINVLRKRHEWLPHLRDDCLTKPELCSLLGVSRSTVDRGIADLEGVELVTRTRNGYQLTEFGCLLLQLRTSYTEALGVICSAQEMQASLPSGQYGEQVVFDGGEVVLPEPHVPEKPTRRILELLTESRAVCGFTPVIHDQYVSTSYKQIRDGSLQFDFIITEQILDCIKSMYADWFVEALDTPAFTIYTIADLPSFGIAIFTRADGSQTVVMAIYADNGLCGVVQNDTRRAIGWANQLFTEYKQSAPRVDFADVRQLEEHTDTS